MNCPKCSGEMEEGTQVDMAPRGPLQAIWVKGMDLPAIRSTLSGLKWMGEHYLVIGYRCKDCGFLEHYAKEKG